MIELVDVTKNYRTHLVETCALDSLSLAIEEGEFVSVSGPSGSGKTTFLNVVGLLDTFDQGTYTIDGRDVSMLTDRAQSRIRNEKIGFIFQGFNLIPDLDVFDNVDVPLRYRRLPREERRERIVRSLELVGLGGRLKHLPSQLSGGQQQRVAIARALASNPRLILADEPTGNLDSATAAEIMHLLHEINEEGATILMVTHDAGCAAQAQRQIHLLDGRLIDYRPSEAPNIRLSQIAPAS
jgi:putative ABC transport system ATP-binding protein